MNRLMKKLCKMGICLMLAVTMALCLAPQEMGTVSAADSISGMPEIEGLPDDFICGADISAITALENSGITYKYLDGTEGDIFAILKGAGINYVRIRIWNNPYDSTAPYKGYGGGNCELYNAKVLGKRATDAGMKVLIDFHYSDFWADPAKQYAPKAWMDYDLHEKKMAVYNFTHDSLCELLDYGVDVQMVQIGNETNGSMCGVGGLYDNVWDFSTGVAALMQEGCYAVDDVNTQYNRNILKALHFAALIDNGEWYAEQINKMGVDYDVFAASFYPMWDGSPAKMASVLAKIAKTYNKKVMVAETGYPYTFADADGSVNNINGYGSMNHSDYPVTVAGQAQALYDVLNGVAGINASQPGYGLGAFYWEPEWIGPDSSTWGACGSGWASSTSGNYELLFASSVKEYSLTDRGSSWDNMTLFDASGKATTALYVFNDIRGAQSVTSAKH